jgi:hypothetical protein
MKWQFFARTEWGRPELERALRFGDRPFREGLRGQCWSGEEQGERRDGEETRKPHDGTLGGDVRGEYADTRLAWFAREFWSRLRRRRSALVAVLDALERSRRPTFMI